MKSIADFTVLLIEDDDMKAHAIKDFLKKKRAGNNLEVVRSVNSALESLRARKFDFVLADMSLPTYDISKGEAGGTPRPFGGIDVFDHIDNSDQKLPIIAVTSFPVLEDRDLALSFNALKGKLEEDFGEIFAGIVFYDQTSSDWENKLWELILGLER